MNELRRLWGDPGQASRWQAAWCAAADETQVVVLLAATATAAIPGISAAGATPESRRLTAAADAELLVLGPGRQRPHGLPPLPAGVSPALISQVVVDTLGLHPLVVDLGCALAPSVPHLRLPGSLGAGPARCLTSGRAMDRGTVAGLLALGRRWGVGLGKARSPRPLLLAECVPGGTSTAQAVLSGLGLAVEGLVGSSLRDPDPSLKAQLVRQGLAAAGLGLSNSQGQGPPPDADPLAVVAAVGDPMQPVAAGLVLAAAAQGLPVLLAGGSQMAAVLALALALAPASLRAGLAAQVAIGTTAWVANDPSSNLGGLLQTLERRWGVTPLGLVADLRFHAPQHPALLDYERGFVKEGVGAGGLALAWQLSGRRPQAQAWACDRACHLLLAEKDLGASTVPP